MEISCHGGDLFPETVLRASAGKGAAPRRTGRIQQTGFFERKAQTDAGRI